MGDEALFLAVLEAGSFSAAARALGASQSTVSRGIAALERRAGVRLFVRRGTHAEPTAAALRLRAVALAARGAATAFERALEASSEAAAGLVRLSTAPELAAHLLAPRLAQLRARFPAVQLELVGEARLADVAAGEADLALRVAAPKSPELIQRRVGILRYRVYGTARAWKHDDHFVGYDAAHALLPEAVWTREHAGTTVATLGPPAAVAAACAAGLGLALLPEGLAAPNLVGSPDVKLARAMFLVQHRDLARTAKNRAVADWVVWAWADAERAA
jgi:DNA-binding transcriptional LysR family regulator